MPRKPVRRRAARNARRLLTALTAVIAVVVTALPAVAIRCDPDVDCIGTRHADNLYGTKHPDRIFGRAGDDEVWGRRGRDRINGGKGADHVDGGPKGDELFGKGGGDVLIAGDARDPSDGNPVDYLFGGGGDDELRSDGEDDTMRGGPGDDTLVGTKFWQTLQGGGGDDALYGKNWKDLYVLDSESAPNGWGHDVIVDRSSANYLWLPEKKENPPDVRVNLVASPSRPEVKAVGGLGTVNWKGKAIKHVRDGRGNDTILGNAENNSIESYWGKDTIYARGGNDNISVYGPAVNDSDKINCGAGYDRVFLHPSDDAAANCEYVYVRPT